VEESKTPPHQVPTPVSSGVPMKFTEKHLIESLAVGAVIPQKPVMFYSMLNQGNKRGKETQVLALDCERILTKEGERLARVSIVNFYGNIVFDTLVKPCDYHDQQFEVLDYREWITGIKPIDLQHAPSFSNIAPILQKIVRGKTIVGHSLADDLQILKIDIDEQEVEIRDISNIELFMNKIDRDSRSPVKVTEKSGSNVSSPIKSINSSGGSKKSSGRRKMTANYVVVKRRLKDLAEEFLNAEIQAGHHSSIIDSRAALALYRMNYEDIEIKYRCQEALHEVTKKYNKDQRCGSPPLGEMTTKAKCFNKVTGTFKPPGAQKSTPVQEIKYLMENKEKLFNITPPNLKKGSTKLSKMPKPVALQQPSAPFPHSMFNQNVAEMEQKLQGLNLDPFTQSWSFNSVGTDQD